MKEKRPGEKSRRGEVTRALLSFSQIGVTIAACLFIGVFLGRFLDTRLGTAPWLLLGFSLLGMAAAFRQIFVWAKK